MDLPVHRMVTSHGIPVYFEEYPDVIRPVSVILCMMSGAADDISLNAPGIHHWGEHLPFRGTVGYPDGKNDISGYIADLGGSVNAYTSRTHTAYYATMPKSHWREVTARIVDLAARPLNRVEDIEAERTIIGQEINQRSANVDTRAYDLMRQSVWGEHPNGSNIIGTHETLNAMDVGMINRMREQSYGRKRCVMFVAGALKASDVLSYAEELMERMPDPTISERRVPASYGLMPAWRGGVHVCEEAPFETTVTLLAFPLPGNSPQSNVHWTYAALGALLSAGSLAAPLQRVVREERQLAYEVSTGRSIARDGEIFLLRAKTSREKVESVINAFWDVLALPEIRSIERFNRVKKIWQARYDMELPDPESGTSGMRTQLFDDFVARSDSETIAHLLRTPHVEVMQLLDTLTKERGRIITLLGTK